ncbi:glycoside hydrolase family 128 protein [Hypholoma sublateritium FD-334 SS-4]|uniref:Glycoside hydrolase family 128 protein n=1 Tax=Hypholoma sublateritium (strain FD-334 SS-4) TaxID=945553 RepID=A0A0D2LF70_HYPSF|nr:glycoside hydrolase family 128 protein [Hypholoma sublateritium FD-334 SS-4]
MEAPPCSAIPPNTSPPFFCLVNRLVAFFSLLKMVSIGIRAVFCAIVLAGHVGANHIKRHHHFSARNQCRPRLHPSEAVETTGTALSTHGPCSTHLSSTSSSTHTEATSTPPAKSTHTTAVAVVHTTSSTSAQAASASAAHATPDSDASQQALSATYIPNSIKAGIAGGDAYPFMESHIGWWYDWSATPSKPGAPVAVPMLWGDGTVDAQDASRFKAFAKLTSSAAAAPRFVLGYEEPDCPSGAGSAGMSVADGVATWQAHVAPLRARGTKLGSPSMCKQADETWLAQFAEAITTPWDFTAVHINKNSLAGVQKDIAHYKKYGKPIWVTEFACVDDVNGFTPCTDQGEINAFINAVVPYFERTPDVYAYAYSNGLGLGDVWPLMDGGALSESGKTYLAAISKYH